MGTRVRAVRFNDVEDALVVEAAGRAGLRVNAWVRRACREAAALEAAVDREDSAPRVAVVPGPLLPPVRSFNPDFGKRLKP